METPVGREDWVFAGNWAGRHCGCDQVTLPNYSEARGILHLGLCSLNHLSFSPTFVSGSDHDSDKIGDLEE